MIPSCFVRLGQAEVNPELAEGPLAFFGRLNKALKKELKQMAQSFTQQLTPKFQTF